MFPESQTKQLFTILIITNIFLAASFAGVYYLLNNRAVQASELAGEIQSIRSQNEREQSINALAENTAEARESLNNYFIQPNNSANFITRIEQIAEDTRVGLQIVNVSIQPYTPITKDDKEGENNQDNKFFENLVLEIQATGSWQRVLHFVRVLELLPEKAHIADVSFEQSNESGPNESTPPWSVNLTIRAVKLASS